MFCWPAHRTRLIIGFNVRPETKARQLAEAEHVEIKSLLDHL